MDFTSLTEGQLRQYIDAESSFTTVAQVRSVAPGALFVPIAAIGDTAYGWAGSVAPALKRLGSVRKAWRWLTGGAFISLGVLTAFSSAKAPAS